MPTWDDWVHRLRGLGVKRGDRRSDEEAARFADLAAVVRRPAKQGSEVPVASISYVFQGLRGARASRAPAVARRAGRPVAPRVLPLPPLPSPRITVAVPGGQGAACGDIPVAAAGRGIQAAADGVWQRVRAALVQS